MSWDGQWYHQTAIYQMAHGWNPLRDPMRAFDPSLQDYVRHYAKGAWYDALALFQTTGHIEWAKPAPWISLAAMFLAVAAAFLEFGMSRRKAILLATLVSLNPVVVCELATYQVDGLWISFLACWAAAVAVSFRRSGGVLLLNAVAVTSAILCINSKFSALVFLCFFCAAGGLYLLIRRRRMLLRWASLQLTVILFAAVVFGFNPYVTNTIHRGHPFYPWMGSAAWPSYADRGPDPNEKWETPKNMVGRNRFVRFSYGLFGRPGAQPYYPGKNAALMWPFDVRWSDFEMFYFLDVRIAGFGPLFSGAVRWTAAGLAALLMVNALLVAFVHLRWEAQSTRAVAAQIAFLRRKSDVEVNIPWFHEPVAERLRAAGVTFHESRTLHCAQPMDLMSVPKGYPGQVRACVP